MTINDDMIDSGVGQDIEQISQESFKGGVKKKNQILGGKNVNFEKKQYKYKSKPLVLLLLLKLYA